MKLFKLLVGLVVLTGMLAFPPYQADDADGHVPDDVQLVSDGASQGGFLGPQPRICPVDSAFDWIVENADYSYRPDMMSMSVNDPAGRALLESDRLMLARERLDVKLREIDRARSAPRTRSGDDTNIMIVDMTVGGSAIDEWGGLSMGKWKETTTFDLTFQDNTTAGGTSVEAGFQVRQLPMTDDVQLDEGKLYDRFSKTVQVTTTGDAQTDTVFFDWTPDFLDLYLLNFSLRSDLDMPMDDPMDNFWWVICYVNTLQDSCSASSKDDWELDPPGGSNSWNLVSQVYQDPGDGNPDNDARGGSSTDQPDTEAVHSLDGAWYCGSDLDHRYRNNVKDSMILQLDYPPGFPREELDVENYALAVAYKFHGSTQQGTSLKNYQDGDHFRTYTWDPEDGEWDLQADLNGSGAIDGWFTWKTGDFTGLLLNTYTDSNNMVLDGLALKLEFCSDAAVNDLGIFVDDVIVYGVQVNMIDFGIAGCDPVIPVAGESQDLGFTVRNHWLEDQNGVDIRVNVEDESGEILLDEIDTIDLKKKMTGHASVEWTVPDIEEPARFKVTVAVEHPADEFVSNDEHFYWLWATPSFAGDADVLLVDNDYGIMSTAWYDELYNPWKDTERYMVDDLWDLGEHFNVATIPWRGMFPDAEYLLSYDTVIWMSGLSMGYYSLPIDPSEEAHLMEFLNSSGNLWLIGQAIPSTLLGYYPWATDLPTPAEGDFLYDYLKVESVEPHRGTANPMKGKTGTYWDGYLSSTACLFLDRDTSHDYAPGLKPRNGASAVLGGPNASARLVDNAIFYDGDDYRLLLFGFEYSFIESPADRKDLVEMSMTALDGGELRFGNHPPQVEVCPGQSGQVVITVYNDGTRPDSATFKLGVDEPEGWDITVADSPMIIPPMDSRDVSVDLRLDDDLSLVSLTEGFDDVNVKLQCISENTEDVTDTILERPFRVGAIRRLNIDCDQNTVEVEPGELRTLALKVTRNTNGDDSPSTVSLGVSGVPWVTGSKSSLSLSSDGVGDGTLSINADPTTPPGDYQITVTVSEGDVQAELRLNVTVSRVEQLDIVLSKGSTGNQPADLLEFDLEQATDGYVSGDVGLFVFNNGNVEAEATITLSTTNGNISDDELPSVPTITVKPGKRDNYALALDKNRLVIPDSVIPEGVLQDISTELVVTATLASGATFHKNIPMIVLHRPVAIPVVDMDNLAIHMDGVKTDTLVDHQEFTLTFPVSNEGDLDATFEVMIETTEPGKAPKKQLERMSVAAGGSDHVEFNMVAHRSATYRLRIDGGDVHDDGWMDINMDISPWVPDDEEMETMWRANDDDKTDSDGDGIYDWWEEWRYLDPDDAVDADSQTLDAFRDELDEYGSHGDQFTGKTSGSLPIIMILVVAASAAIGVFMVMNRKKKNSDTRDAGEVGEEAD